jgi:hypothetical protein
LRVASLTALIDIGLPEIERTQIAAGTVDVGLDRRVCACRTQIGEQADSDKQHQR